MFPRCWRHRGLRSSGHSRNRDGRTLGLTDPRERLCVSGNPSGLADPHLELWLVPSHLRPHGMTKGITLHAVDVMSEDVELQHLTITQFDLRLCHVVTVTHPFHREVYAVDCEAAYVA